MSTKKKVLLTGASRGLGQSIKKFLLETGDYNVLAPSRDQLNLSSIDSIKSYTKEHADIDILINNAGINILAPLGEVSAANLETMISTNLTGSLWLTQSVVPSMQAKRWGRILNISSIWGVSSKESRVMYSMTKFGLNGLTKALAKELGPSSILVNSLCPGFIDTEMTRKNISVEEKANLERQIPLRRFGAPEDIAKIAYFLVSDLNTYITGQFIVADGGFL